MNTSPFDQFKSFFQQKSILVKLIKINILVWILISLISLISFLFNLNVTEKVLFWLTLPSDLTIFLIKPWTIATYMFSHKDFFHILFNMMMLYFGGVLFTQLIGTKKLLQTYILGGIFGGVFYMIAFNFFPVFNPVIKISSALGASASVLAIIAAIATFSPDTRVQLILFGNVKLKYIALILIFIDIISIEKGNAGGHIAHLGGAFYGALFAVNLKYKYIRVPDLNLKSFFERKPKMKYYKNDTRPVSDEEYNAQKVERQKKIDVILDKISKSGYDSLSKEEKQLLFQASNKK
jgi:membrane associated rhomboid family serine protease